MNQSMLLDLPHVNTDVYVITTSHQLPIISPLHTISRNERQTIYNVVTVIVVHPETEGRMNNQRGDARKHQRENGTVPKKAQP